MDEVKRYYCIGHDGDMDEDQSGDWVSFEDYEALRAHLADVELSRNRLSEIQHQTREQLKAFIAGEAAQKARAEAAEAALQWVADQSEVPPFIVMRIRATASPADLTARALKDRG